MQKSSDQIEKYLRLRTVLQIIPVSRSTWYRGMGSGIYPRPVKFSRKISAWRLSDIAKLAENPSAIEFETQVR